MPFPWIFFYFTQVKNQIKPCCTNMKVFQVFVSAWLHVAYTFRILPSKVSNFLKGTSQRTENR